MFPISCNVCLSLWTGHWSKSVLLILADSEIFFSFSRNVLMIALVLKTKIDVWSFVDTSTKKIKLVGLVP